MPCISMYIIAQDMCIVNRETKFLSYMIAEDTQIVNRTGG